MNNNFFKTIKTTVQHWYLLLIVGLIFTCTGIYTFYTPIESYVTLSMLFSITFLASGISEIIFSISNRNELDNWGWTLIFGLFTTLLGVLLLINPAISITTLPFYVGFLILFRSAGGISYALELKNYGIKDWGNLMAICILGVLFSFLLLWNPLFAGLTLVYWTALAFVCAGIFCIYLSFKLKSLKNMPTKISKNLIEKYTAIKEEIQAELNQK
ncbi:HdeD family acid-resistance protein [Pedobacter sp. MW01-1-1]|uniref:HdeD family acid-resistance protein n=1 Tax=Pedobacter sp. MW01-1-1 TaxID=3383027 RepID=UPI003FF0D5DC